MKHDKVTLERSAGDVLEIHAIGRHVHVTENGVETTIGCFDDSEAIATATDLIAARLASGWRESAATRARRDEATASAVRAAAYQALATADDPARAFLAHVAPLAAASAGAATAFAALAAHVTAIDEADAGGFRVRLRGGGALLWGAPEPVSDGPPGLLAVLAQAGHVWLYRDADELARNDHALCFGAGVGPPEGDAEIADTAFAGAPVRWFLEEAPHDRYWFVAGDGAARCYEFDGGLHDEPHGEPIAELLATLITAKLADGPASE